MCKELWAGLSLVRPHKGDRKDPHKLIATPKVKTLRISFLSRKGIYILSVHAVEITSFGHGHLTFLAIVFLAWYLKGRDKMDRAWNSRGNHSSVGQVISPGGGVHGGCRHSSISCPGYHTMYDGPGVSHGVSLVTISGQRVMCARWRINGHGHVGQLGASCSDYAVFRENDSKIYKTQTFLIFPPALPIPSKFPKSQMQNQYSRY